MAPHIARMLVSPDDAAYELNLGAGRGVLLVFARLVQAGWRYFVSRSAGSFQALLARRTLSICYVNRAGKSCTLRDMSGSGHAQPDLQIHTISIIFVAIFQQT